MPKSPILRRTLLYTKIRSGNRNPTYRLLDWCLVETAFGPAMEPRAVDLDGSKIMNDDVNDSSFNAIMEVEEGKLREQFGTFGPSIPADYGL